MAGVTAHADVESLMPVLWEAVRPGDVVLVKASRSARLERVTAGLLGRLGERKVS
jgi:UDP-N-acetylmuramyl pentapeptide synthase